MNDDEVSWFWELRRSINSSASHWMPMGGPIILRKMLSFRLQAFEGKFLFPFAYRCLHCTWYRGLWQFANYWEDGDKHAWGGRLQLSIGPTGQITNSNIAPFPKRRGSIYQHLMVQNTLMSAPPFPFCKRRILRILAWAARPIQFQWMYIITMPAVAIHGMHRGMQCPDFALDV